MKVPTSDAHQALRMIVRQRLSSYTITRPAGSSPREALGETLPDENTTTHNADLWLFAPRDSPVETDFGDRLQGSLQGLAMPNTDIDYRDRVTFNGVEYEVSDIIEMPDEQNTVLQMFGLEKKVN